MRHLVDDGAIATLNPAGEDLGAVLFDLGGLLTELQHEGEQVGFLGIWSQFRIDRTDLGTVLSDALVGDPTVRDVALLTMSALDRCVAWDADPELLVDPSVEVDGSPWESFAVARCADVLRDDGQVTACITFGRCFEPGPHAVRRADGTTEQVPFLVGPGDGMHVARRRLIVESRTEDDFFALVSAAFPHLVFASEVTFRRFEGTFGALRNEVVVHLAALNDHFGPTYRAEAGNLDKVGIRLGIRMSNEGTTRSSERLMRLRDVVVDGRTYRCEIHSKIEPHRNRIHFHPGDEHTGGRVVVGIFVGHLDT